MMKMSILYSLFAVCSLAFANATKTGALRAAEICLSSYPSVTWNVPFSGATEEVDLQAPGEWKVKTDYIAGGERGSLSARRPAPRAAQADAFGRQ